MLLTNLALRTVQRYKRIIISTHTHVIVRYSEYENPTVARVMPRRTCTLHSYVHYILLQHQHVD